MTNSITESVRDFCKDELTKYDYSYKDTKEDVVTFWINEGSSLSKRIKASVLSFTKNGKNLLVVVPDEGNVIRVEIEVLKRDEKLFLTTSFSQEQETLDVLSRELKKELLKAGMN